MPYRACYPIFKLVYSAAAENDRELRTAVKYASIGCFDLAAETFQSLANTFPTQADLWHSAGVCRAYDGNHEAATQALQKAAELYRDSDFEMAVQCATVAQLLEQTTEAGSVPLLLEEAKIASVSRLLTTFDQAPLLVRAPVPPRGDENVVAVYHVLERPLNAVELALDTSNLTYDQLPGMLGDVTIYDVDPLTNEPAVLQFTAVKGTPFEVVSKTLREVAGDQLTWSEKPAEPVDGLPLDYLSLFQPRYLIYRVPGRQRVAWLKQRWQSAVVRWKDTPLKSLGGKSPREASSLPEMKLALTAAVYVLDAFADRWQAPIDSQALLEELHLSRALPSVLPEAASVSTLSTMSLIRLDVPSLTDEQLMNVLSRAMLLNYNRFLHQALTNALSRPELQTKFSPEKIYSTLADLAKDSDHHQESLHWIEEARKHAPNDGKTFEHALRWDLKELAIRITDPQDEVLKGLIQKFVTYYCPKIPELRPNIETLLHYAGIPSPWESADGIVTGDSLAGVGAGSSGGLWTPDQAGSAAPASTESSGSKLWLPGS